MFALLRALHSTLRPDVEAGGGREWEVEDNTPT